MARSSIGFASIRKPSKAADRRTGTTASEDFAMQPTSPRRRFLKQAAVAASGIAAVAPQAAAAEPPSVMPTDKFDKPALPRLIIGGNPVYGYSHFNKILSRHMADWHTPERVQALLKRCEEAGINTWQNSYAERSLQDVDRYREAGGK